jgi:hypothetical protein
LFTTKIKLFLLITANYLQFLSSVFEATRTYYFNIQILILNIWHRT